MATKRRFSGRRDTVRSKNATLYAKRIAGGRFKAMDATGRSLKTDHRRAANRKPAQATAIRVTVAAGAPRNNIPRILDPSHSCSWVRARIAQNDPPQHAPTPSALRPAETSAAVPVRSLGVYARAACAVSARTTRKQSAAPALSVVPHSSRSQARRTVRRAVGKKGGLFRIGAQLNGCGCGQGDRPAARPLAAAKWQ
jgi:hypothetical protein